ncbi:MAG TPA: hypothetical protein VJV03_04885 [Pyrinomonadaceae bacterium]|nr:hypothetical protein [Pyrinomonadaceae bacterium]
MQKKSPTAFQVRDKEVITINVKSTGTATLFGVNYSIFGAGTPLKEGQPLQITMDKQKAQGNSTIPNAKSTPLTLLFSFTSATGGKYELTMTGDAGGDSITDSTRQAGSSPKAILYTFHIV